MIKQLFLLAMPLAILVGCQSKTDTSSAEVSTESDDRSQAEAWIQKAVTAHGSEALSVSEISFDFRGKDFFVQKDGYDYYYQREYVDSLGLRIIDQVWPDSLFRTAGGKRQLLSPEKAESIAESIHSVVYFALLPQALQDPAVQATYLDNTTIKSEPYHRIKVTFSQENGGSDYQDEYLYWIHDQAHTIDYLAYNFQVNGGGARFRAVSLDTLVADVRFQDYKNYKPNRDGTALRGLDSLYEIGELELLSTIELNDIEVAIIEE